MADVSAVTGDGPSVYEIFADYRTMVDPYPLYRRVLAERPVDSTGGPLVLTRYDDVAAALRHPGLSADDRRDSMYRAMVEAGTVTADTAALVDRRSLLHRDPPDHTRLRGVFDDALSSVPLDEVAAVAQRFVDDTVDRVAERGHLDLVADLAYPLPLHVVCRLLGVDPRDHVDAPWWRSQLCADFEAPAVAEAGCVDYSKTVQAQLVAYFDKVLAERPPRGPFPAALLAAHDRGTLSADEVNDCCRLLLVSGHETTTCLIANGVLALLRHPDQWRLLSERPDLAAPAVDEVIRFDAPIQFTRRVAATDVEVNGVPIAAGQLVLIWLAPANRDDARFVEPDRFDITRRAEHVGFGAGSHTCPGTAIARVQAEITLRTLCRRLIGPVLAADPPPYLPSAVHAVKELRVEVAGTRPR
jgi:cytochrome P450